MPYTKTVGFRKGKRVRKRMPGNPPKKLTQKAASRKWPRKRS